MPKVKTVKSARPSAKTRRCRRCGHEIQVGEEYKHFSKKTGPRSSVTYNYCANHYPRRSELMSGRAAELEAIIENYDDDMKKCKAYTQGTLKELVTILNTTQNDITSLADDIEDAATNIEDGFGHSTAQSEAMTDTASELHEWADSIQEVIDTIEVWEPEDPEDEDGTEKEIEDLFLEAEMAINEQPELNLTG